MMYQFVQIVVLSQNTNFVAVAQQSLDDKHFDVKHIEGRPDKKKWQSNKRISDIVVIADLTDMAGPGTEILTDIKVAAPFASVIAVSNRLESQFIRNCFLLGADGVITVEDYTKRIKKLVSDMVQKGLAPVSKPVVNQLVNIVQGTQHHRSGTHRLSEMQRQVARLIVNGMSYQEAAELLDININNLRYHIKQIYKKMGIHRKMELYSMFSAEG